jgi:hypothetical protein
MRAVAGPIGCFTAADWRSVIGADRDPGEQAFCSPYEGVRMPGRKSLCGVSPRAWAVIRGSIDHRTYASYFEDRSKRHEWGYSLWNLPEPRESGYRGFVATSMT